MPTETQPKFKIGDAIEIVNFVPDIEAKAIVVDIFNHHHYRLWFFEPMDEFDIDMDDKYKNILTIEEDASGRFILCDTEYCNECEYNELCPHLPDIARCEFSEFGQLRKGSKTIGIPLDTEACIKCEHRGVCWGQRFIQV